METRPFYQTSEFWGTVVTQILIAALMFAETISTEVGMSLLTVGTAGYGLARGVAKSGSPAKKE